MTRFIALGSVGNAAKAKSLHALALVPAAEMDVATLTQRPEGTTPCPYELPSTSKRSAPDDPDGLGEQVGIPQPPAMRHFNTLSSVDSPRMSCSSARNTIPEHPRSHTECCCQSRVEG